MIESLNAGRYRLQEAIAEQRRAALGMQQADEAATRQQLATTLAPIIATAKLTMPASFTDSESDISKDLDEGRKQADASYKESDDLLENVTSGTAAKDQHAAAQIVDIFTQYAWSLLAASVGDAQSAETHLNAAKAARDAAIDAGSVVTNLPPELAIAAKSATPAAQ